MSLTALVACGGPPRVTDYGPEARENFVDACTIDRTIEDGEQVETRMAAESFCGCVYEGIRDTYKLSWDELTDYESKVADAEPGDLPKPPTQLTKAMEACNTTGPAAPSDTSQDETTTTDG